MCWCPVAPSHGCGLCVFLRVTVQFPLPNPAPCWASRANVQTLADEVMLVNHQSLPAGSRRWKLLLNSPKAFREVTSSLGLLLFKAIRTPTPASLRFGLSGGARRGDWTTLCLPRVATSGITILAPSWPYCSRGSDNGEVFSPGQRSWKRDPQTPPQLCNAPPYPPLG